MTIGIQSKVYVLPEMYGIKEQRIVSRLNLDQPQTDGSNQGAEVEAAVVKNTNHTPADIQAIIQDINAKLKERGLQAATEEVCPAVVEQDIPHGTAKELEYNFLRYQAALMDVLGEMNLTLMPFGLLPYSGREEAQRQMFAALKRHTDAFYRKVLIPRDGEKIKALTHTSGLQIHVEQRHGFTAIMTVRALSLLSPLFISIWASSPIIDGFYRGYNSERMQQKSLLPNNLTGLIPNEAVSSFHSMQDWLQRNAHDTRYLSISPGYFWIRQPRVKLGTVENSTMDMNPNVELIILGMRLTYAIAMAVARDMKDNKGLPEEIFGSGDLTENNRKWVYSLNDQLQRSTNLFNYRFTDINGVNISVPQFLKKVMDWCNLPIKDQNALINFLGKGTIAERILRKLNIQTGQEEAITGQKEKRMKDVYLEFAEIYKNAITEKYNKNE